MLEFAPNEDQKSSIASELISKGIRKEGIKIFYGLYGRCLYVDAYDWMFRSCFMKDGKIVNDCAIMQFGDGHDKEGFPGFSNASAESALMRSFGLLARTSMLDNIVLATCSLLSTGKDKRESSFSNFTEHCPDDIRELINNEVGLDIIKDLPKAQELHNYRNSRAAHYDHVIGIDQIRPVYSTIEECIDRIFRAMNVVFQMPPRVDWKKRGVIRRQLKYGEYTTNIREPFIIQFLKELQIRRINDLIHSLYTVVGPDIEASEYAQLKINELFARIEEIKVT